MSERDTDRGYPLSWLLEAESPGVRYLALRDVLDRPPDDPELRLAREVAHTKGPIAAILSEMDEPGYWVQPGPGYLPKYRSSVWSIITLAQLGAVAELDVRIARACGYLLDHALAAGGKFTMSGAPSGTLDCLQGNLCAALVDIGCDDPRLAEAFEWMARTVTGEGIAPMEERQATERYYAGMCGPGFVCGGNNKQACAWGAVKVMLAFGRWPAERRTPAIDRAIERGVDFLLGTDPARADYPSGWADKPSGNWWKFGFPVFYVTDVLQIVEALGALRCGADPRLANVVAIIRDKRDAHGRWALEYDYSGKTWVDFGPRRQPNKWVTIRALRALREVRALE